MSNIGVIRPVGLRNQFQLDTFFETGCFKGESMLLAYAAGFQKVISCDISLDRVSICRTLFPCAAVLHAESTYALGPLMPHIVPVMGRTLFWLDAQCGAARRRHEQSGHPLPTFEARPQPERSAGVQKRAAVPQTAVNRFPLVEELRLIRENKPGYERDVIAFDDLRVIRDPENPRYRAGELAPPEDRLYVEISIQELIAPFAATHTAALTLDGEGALVLMPKAA